MYTRCLPIPPRSFFLFGPRATGKTTWLRQVLPNAHWFDLLRTDVYLELARQPELFRARVEALPKSSWVVVDEVQRMPNLLNEVQDLISRHGNSYRFALSGSSARKLKRMDSNLLAGRAFTRSFFPLTSEETGFKLDLDEALRFGRLPMVVDEPGLAVETLDAYVTTYLREEILQEAQVRNLDSFSRFLEVAALMNGQIVNVSGVARDAAVARPTVEGYFDILVDTLIGVRLPAWRNRARVKEVARPKFYLFDPGVARALAGRHREPIDDVEKGFLLETLVLHELRAAMCFQQTGGELSFWRTPSGSEVDFIWQRGTRTVGIEVKASKRWKSEYGIHLKTLLVDKALTAAYAIYTGREEMRDGDIHILPAGVFFQRLAAGKIL